MDDNRKKEIENYKAIFEFIYETKCLLSDQQIQEIVDQNLKTGTSNIAAEYMSYKDMLIANNELLGDEDDEDDEDVDIDDDDDYDEEKKEEKVYTYHKLEDIIEHYTPKEGVKDPVISITENMEHLFELGNVFVIARGGRYNFSEEEKEDVDNEGTDEDIFSLCTYEQYLEDNEDIGVIGNETDRTLIVTSDNYLINEYCNIDYDVMYALYKANAIREYTILVEDYRRSHNIITIWAPRDFQFALDREVSIKIRNTGQEVRFNNF